MSKTTEAMNRSTNPHVALFMNMGYGLDVFMKVGCLDRETAIYKKLSKIGYNIVFFTYDNSKCPSNLDFPAQIVSQWPWVAPRAITRLYFLFLPLLRYATGRKISVIVTNQAFNVWPAIIAGWIWRAKVIVRCGYVYGEEVETLNFNRDHVRRKIIFFEKWTFRRADRCFIPTNETAEWVVKNYGIDRAKIDVVPNCVDTAQFKPDICCKKEIDVLCLGRLADVKRYHLILEALKDLNIKVSFIGNGPLELSVREIAIANGIDLTIINRVPNQDLPHFFNKSKIYLIASRKEGHPRSLVEAMACGCACIGTYSPGITNQIENEKTGLLTDPKPESISRCVKRLLDDETLRKSLGNNARQYALDYFALDKAFNHYKKTIIHLTGVNLYPPKFPEELMPQP